MGKKHTNTEIVKFRAKLLREDSKITKNITELKSEDPFLNPDHASDNAAIDTDIREQMGHETIEAQIASLKKRQQRIHSALKKLETGRYGVCENCGEAIAAARLDLVPEARYCIDCERKLVL